MLRRVACCCANWPPGANLFWTRRIRALSFPSPSRVVGARRGNISWIRSERWARSVSGVNVVPASCSPVWNGIAGDGEDEGLPLNRSSVAGYRVDRT